MIIKRNQETNASIYEHVKMCIFGPTGMGKTSLLWSLPEDQTLFLDLEAGGSSVKGWNGYAVDYKDCNTWGKASDILKSFILHDMENRTHDFEKLCNKIGMDPDFYEKVEYIFIDSISALSQFCHEHYRKKYPQDSQNWDMYAKIAEDMIRVLKGVHEYCQKTVIYTCLTEEKRDKYNLKSIKPVMAGQSTFSHFPKYIHCFLKLEYEGREKESTSPLKRRFLCMSNEETQHFSKDRSGTLDMYEEPNILNIIQKIKEGERKYRP